MSTPTIHHLGNSFDERNVCLHAALGMISFLRRFKKVLRGHVSSSTQPANGLDPESRRDDALLYATLGLISFSTRMMHYLPATKTEASGLRAQEASVRSQDDEARPAIRELLR